MTDLKPWEIGRKQAVEDEPQAEPKPKAEPEVAPQPYADERGYFNAESDAPEDQPVKRYQAPEDTPFQEMAWSSYAEQLRKRNTRAYRPNEIAFREMFVREFIKDWHQTKAAIRAGVSPGTASAKASALMQEEYVLRRINELIEEQDEEVFLTRKRVIVGLLNEANNHSMGSSHGARVNAWKTLGDFMGMKITRVEQEVTHKGNVMIIPASPSGDTYDAETWEEAAHQAQQALKDQVRD